MFGGSYHRCLHRRRRDSNYYHCSAHRKGCARYASQAALSGSLPCRLEFTLPVRASTPTLPAVCTDTQGPLRWRIEWATIRDGKLAARSHAELERCELSKPETIRFQQQLGALFSASGIEAGLAVQDPIAAH
jgi:hypothetical protein